VGDLGVELDPVQAPLRVLEPGHRGGVGAGHDPGARWRGGDRVAVAHPDDLLAGQVAEQHAALGLGPQGGAAVLPDPGRLDPAAQDPGHGLLAVAEPEDRDAQLQQARVEGGGARLVHRLGAAGQDQGLGAVGADRLRVDVAGDDLGEDVAFADAAGDELGVLGAEVEHQDGVVAGCRSRHGRRITDSSGWLPGRLAEEYGDGERGFVAPWCPDLAPHTERRSCGAFLFSRRRRR
jgi:hypothetical protein